MARGDFILEGIDGDGPIGFFITFGLGTFVGGAGGGSIFDHYYPFGESFEDAGYESFESRIVCEADIQDPNEGMKYIVLDELL